MIGDPGLAAPQRRTSNTVDFPPEGLRQESGLKRELYAKLDDTRPAATRHGTETARKWTAAAGTSGRNERCPEQCRRWVGSLEDMPVKSIEERSAEVDDRRSAIFVFLPMVKSSFLAPKVRAQGNDRPSLGKVKSAGSEKAAAL